LNGSAWTTDVARDALSGTCASDAPLRVGSKALGKPFVGQLDDLRLYNRRLTPQQVEDLAIHHPMRVILSGVTGKPTKDEADRTRTYFLTHAAPDTLRTSYASSRLCSRRRTISSKTIRRRWSWREMKKPRDTFVLARGDYRNQTDKVEPGVPAILPKLPEGSPLNG
jgi:hypothetical protein